MKRKYQSEILKAIHEDAAANYAVGAISADEMREYDQNCLVPPAKSARGNNLVKLAAGQISAPVYVKGK
jgi:DNA-binding transcriptional regulator YiaG